MKDNKLADLSMNFSVQIVNLVKDLKSKHESVTIVNIDCAGGDVNSTVFNPYIRAAVGASHCAPVSFAVIERFCRGRQTRHK